MSQLISLLWIFFLLLIFYVLVIRPQKNRLRERQELIAGIVVGDRIETIGGIQGVVVSLDTETIELQIAPEVTVVLSRRAVGSRVGEEV